MAALPYQPAYNKRQLAEHLFALAQLAQERGLSAEELLRREIKRRERALRSTEKRQHEPTAVPRYSNSIEDLLK